MTFKVAHAVVILPYEVADHRLHNAAFCPLRIEISVRRPLHVPESFFERVFVSCDVKNDDTYRSRPGSRCFEVLGRRPLDRDRILTYVVATV